MKKELCEKCIWRDGDECIPGLKECEKVIKKGCLHLIMISEGSKLRENGGYWLKV